MTDASEPPSRVHGIDRVAIALAVVVVAVRLPFAGRYDIFRDELYFIVCGRHPQFGYVDQPPIVPLVAAWLWGLGEHVWLLRLPAILAAAVTVALVVRFVRYLGGGDAAAIVAGLAVATAPIFLGLADTLNTTAFEPLAWTIVAFSLVRFARSGERSAPLVAGCAVGLALETKYAIVAWIVALAIGLAATPERRILFRREMAFGIAIALVIAAPSIVWQLTNGMPFVELVGAAKAKNVAVGPIDFWVEQIVVMNPFYAPLWISGIVAPLVMTHLHGVRFIAIAFAMTALVMIVTPSKSYYLAAAYPSLFAIGAVACERMVRNPLARAAYVVPALATSLVLAPIAMPVLPPTSLIAYETRIGLHARSEERAAKTAALPQTFADMLGWRDYVREVGRAWRAIPASARARTAIVVDNYGEAAALDVLGTGYALPPALSGHNQYGMWQLRGQHPRDILRVQRHPEKLRPFCDRASNVGTTQSRFAMPYENGKAIVRCEGLHPQLDRLWATELRHFD